MKNLRNAHIIFTKFKHKQSDLSHYFPSIHTSKWTKLFMRNICEPEGYVFRLKRFCGQLNKMNLTLPCGNLTFYSSRLSSNRSNVGKMELVHRKFLRDLLQAIYDRPREVRLHYKPSYIYIYPIIHSIWSWIMKKIKIKSWRNGF